MASNTIAPSPEDSQDQVGASTVSPDGLNTTPAEPPTVDHSSADTTPADTTPADTTPADTTLTDTTKPEKKFRRKARKKPNKQEFEDLNIPPMQGPVLRRAMWREWRQSLLLFCFVSVYVELCLHLCVFKEIDNRIVYPILFALLGGGIMTFLCTLLPRIPGRILTVLLIAAEVIYAEVQLVYHAIFGNFMPISLAGMGENVVTNFGSQILYGIGQNIVPILLLLIPLILVIVLLVCHRAPKRRTGWKQSLTSVGIVAVISLILGGMLFSQKGETFSVYEILTNVNTSTDTSYKNVGMLATTEQELRYMLLGGFLSQQRFHGSFCPGSKMLLPGIQRHGHRL